MKKPENILIVDDNEGVLTALRLLLKPCFRDILTLTSPVALLSALHVDYNAIGKYVKENSEAYHKLTERFEANDSLLTNDDYALLYYGYSFTPKYKGSMPEDYLRVLPPYVLKLRVVPKIPKVALSAAQLVRRSPWILKMV